jgi:hypothetical protein
MAKKKADKHTHDKLQPYPTDLAEPAKVLLSHMDGDEVSHNCCVHAAYQIQGVVFGKLFPEGHDHSEGMRSVSVETPNEEEGKRLLEECTKTRGPITDMILQQLLAFVWKWLQDQVVFKK